MPAKICKDFGMAADVVRELFVNNVTDVVKISRSAGVFVVVWE
jgi:hypothetical protein